MRYLILSDLHANLEALEAVLETVKDQRFDCRLVLGDLVGYGADPNAVVDRVRALKPEIVIRGNHDKVASGLEDAEGFNAAARQAARWTLETLSPGNREYVANLPVGPRIVDDLVEVCHGSPLDEDLYIFDSRDALDALRSAHRPLCLFGHTHVPIAFRLASQNLEIIPLEMSTTRIQLEPGHRYLVNPGSVGQPRDGDPRAAFAIVDADRREVLLQRVPYEIGRAQQKITAAGLPEALARRLALGR